MKARKFKDNILYILKRPEISILPGQLAFFFILSVVPILTLISYGASYLNISTELISSFLTKYFGEALTEMLIPQITNIPLSFALIVTLFTGFFIASKGAYAIIMVSNRIYDIKNTSYIKRKVKSIFMTILIVILFLFILIVPLFGQSIIKLLVNLHINYKITYNVGLIINVLRGPLSWFIILFFIKIIYTIAPDKKIPASRTTYGALFTSFGWIISTALYSFYINNYAHYSLFYGSLENIIVLMLWTYLLAYIFVLGMALNYKRDNDED